MRAYLRHFGTLSLGVLVITLLGGSLDAAVIVDDAFADGDLAKTGALDSNWWTSSSSSGIEISIGSMGLVTGSSGRGIHTVFPTQTLGNVGDTLTASYTFTTPATIGMGSNAFRVGLFDTLGRTGLNANVSASTGSPNAIYGLAPGTVGLPGYMLDMDINTGVSADLNFREHDATNVSPTGRLLSTTTGFTSFSSGPDAGYTFDPNTLYTGSIAVERISATELQLTGTLGGTTFSVIDDSFASDSFGMLAFHVNSNRFGSSNSPGDPDNGIDFSNITISSTAVPEPGSAAVLLLTIVCAGVFRRRSSFGAAHR